MPRKIQKMQTTNREVNQLQNNIIAAVQPWLDNPISEGRTPLLVSISLSVGANVVLHGLNRALQGWFIVRKRAAADIYDTQDTNTEPSVSLLLTSSAAVVVDLFVF